MIRFLLRPEFHCSLALARDVSATGIGFLLDRPLELGTVLAVQLRMPRPGDAVIRRAEVVHVGRRLPVKDAPWIKKKGFLDLVMSLFGSSSTPDGPEFIWHIGCQFSTPLSEEELQEIV